MADIIETAGTDVLAFLDEDESLNDLQQGEIRRYFQRTRSNLFEYGVLEHEHNYSFHQTPSVHQAVEYKKDPLIPMMIALIPPDVYPSGHFITKEVPAPQDVNVRPVKFKNADGLVDSEVSGNRVSTESDDIFIQTDVSLSSEEGSAEYLTSLKDRYQSFRANAKRADTQIDDHNQPIVIGRDEVKDTLPEKNKSVKIAREPHPNEDYLKGQIEAMRQLPPLVLYVNPTEFSVSYQHVIADGDRGRDFHIIEHWGLQQPTINASGQIGATYIDSTNGRGQKTGGVTRALRRESAAYQHFMNLFQIYKNNAYIFNVHHRISMLGSVKIFYDDAIYTGSFDSFSISEAEDKPYSLEYNFQFTVRFEERVARTSRGEDI